MTILLIFIIGLCLGSFLGVVIDRLPQNKSILVGRSKCQSCQHSLYWYDLIPVISYFILGGKCRYCHKKFSVTYPFFEVFVGAILVGLYFLFGQPSTLSSVVLFGLEASIFLSLLVLSIIDIKEGILPDKIILFSIFLTIIFLFVSQVPLIPYILSAVSALIFFLAIIFGTRGRGMGMGDAKLAFLLGLFLGWPNIFIALYAAFLTGAGAGVILVIVRKKKFRGGFIPFGPFLILGTFLAACWGKILWEITLKFLGV